MYHKTIPFDQKRALAILEYSECFMVMVQFEKSSTKSLGRELQTHLFSSQNVFMDKTVKRLRLGWTFCPLTRACFGWLIGGHFCVEV